MANTTTMYWEVDGTPLNTYAFNIASLGGDRDKVAPLRGDDVLVPFRPGKVWVPKVPDSKTITLAMWVQGTTEGGVKPPTGTAMRQQYEKNWRKLRHLLWQTGRQITLTKRFYDDDGNVVIADAKAEFADGLTSEMVGPYHGAFTVDLRLADPFFYDRTPQNIHFVGSSVFTFTVMGDAMTNRVQLLFNKGTAPQMTNVSKNIVVRSGASVPSGTYIVVDSNLNLMYRNDSKTSFLQYLTHTGSRLWFPLVPGATQFLAESGGGAVDTNLIYYPAYH